MIHERGRVVSVNTPSLPGEPTEAWVETLRKSTCGSCQAKAGCGQSLLVQWADSKRTHIKVVTEQAVAVGDEVVLGIQEHTLVKGSLAAYGLPLLAMVLLTLLASGAGLAEPWVILSALAGLGLGFGAVRLYGRLTDEQAYRPQVVEVVGHHGHQHGEWQPASLP